MQSRGYWVREIVCVCSCFCSPKGTLSDVIINLLSTNSPSGEPNPIQGIVVGVKWELM